MDEQGSARPIVVGTDGSEWAQEAVAWAAREAMRQQRTLRIIGAYVWLDPIRIGDPEHCRRDAQDRVSAAARLARGIAPHVTIDSAVLEGGPRGHLLEESTRAHLVVIGNRGYGGFSGLLMGSISTAVASYAKCPVVVVRNGEATRSSTMPVVVGMDGSALSDTALEFAFEMAAARRTRLIAVHGWSDSLLERVAPVFDPEELTSEEQSALADRLADANRRYPDVTAELTVSNDQPARILIEHSAHAQLVVVGSRGRGGFAGLVLGSTSHAVLHHAHCSVAVVHPTGSGS